MRAKRSGIGGRGRVALSCAATLLAAALASCDDGPAPPEAASLAVSPSSVALEAIGDTAVFTAAVADQYGDPFPAVVAWRTSRPSVFTVTGEGVVRAVANGEGVLTASLGELSATASVSVAQRPSAMDAVGGDGQAVRQGLALAEPVIVEVTDARGTPVQDVVVVFAPADGDGSADPDTIATDAAGRAQTSWTLGDRPGEQSLVASVVGAGEPSVRFSATALTPEETADSVGIVEGDQQRALRGRTLPAPVVFRVLDAVGGPVPGARVAFVPSAGHGVANPDTVATDEDGLAGTTWTLGDEAGPQSLVAAVVRADGPSARAAATALTPEEAADSIELAGGGGQQARQGAKLARPVVFRVLDDVGGPVPGARVFFVPSAGHGVADPDTVATDEDGLAGTTWTLGDEPGAQVLVAAVARAGGPSARAAATALTPEEAAGSIELASGGGQRARQGARLARPVVFRVLDAAGGPVPGARVAFVPSAGHGVADPDTVATDEDGLAGTTWTLGDERGPQSLVAAVARAGGPSARAAATALTPEEAAVSLELASGGGQRALRGTRLARPVVFRALDAAGGPVPGVRVAFVPSAGHGVAAPDTVATNEDGLAGTTWTLGNEPGPQSLVASVARPGGPTAQAAATAVPPRVPVADSIFVASGDGQRAPRGSTLPAPVVVVVLDETGRPLPNILVSFAAAPGHGQARPESDRTDAGGRARTRWTLGEPLGTQRLVVTAAGRLSAQVSATAVERPVTNQPPTVDATVPTLLLQTGGTSVSVSARSLFSDPDGDALAFSAVTDDGSVTQVAVRQDTFFVSPGTGTGSTKIRLTATDAAAASASQTFWTTTLPALDNSSYNIHIADHTETGLSADTLFTQAVARWEQAIAGNLPSQPLLSDFVFDACLERFSVFAEVDDVVVFVTIRDIDGPGGTLAAAGQCGVRRPEDTGLPVFGFIYFDAADRSGVWADDLYDVTLHEFGHVLGIGTLWQGHLVNPSRPNNAGADTHFNGTRARAAFDAAGGTAYTAGEKVPVDNRAIVGSSDVHWRLSVLGDELMTAVIYNDADNPLSAITLQSLADLGYTVNASAADSWTYASARRDAMAAVRRGRAVHMTNDIHRLPVMVLDEDGRVIRIMRR